MDQILPLVLPSVLELASLLVLTLIGWASAAFARKTGIQIKEDQRQQLHDVIMRGLKLAVMENAADRPARAVEYARAYQPDLVAKLNAGPALLDIARMKQFDLPTT